MSMKTLMAKRNFPRRDEEAREQLKGQTREKLYYDIPLL